VWSVDWLVGCCLDGRLSWSSLLWFLLLLCCCDNTSRVVPPQTIEFYQDSTISYQQDSVACTEDLFKFLMFVDTICVQYFVKILQNLFRWYNRLPQLIRCAHLHCKQNRFWLCTLNVQISPVTKTHENDNKKMSVDHDGYAKITMRKTIRVECNNQPSQFHIYRSDLYGQWKSLICHIANFNFFS
jgi:hypothetical protein